jgi:hypothetical protein
MAGYIGSKAVNLSTTGADINGDANIDGDLSFRDNDKIKLGAGSDLQIYHNGSDSFIDDAGTGSLYVRSNSVVLGKYTGEVGLVATADGSVDLYYNDVKKLATTSTGIDVTGTVTADGLTVDATTTVIQKTGDSPTLQLKGHAGSQNTIGEIQSGRAEFSGTNSFMRFKTNDGTSTKTRLNIDANGDISFYEDTGTTAKFFWDASAESLGIGTSSPNISNVGNAVTVNSTSSVIFELAKNGSRVANFYSDGTTASLSNNTNNPLAFLTNNLERMRLDASGNLLVGKTSDNNALEGISLAATGAVKATNSSDLTGIFNRLSTDGDIVQFWKDGTTVGSISNSGTNFIFSK